MAGIVTSNKTRKLVGNRLKEIDVPTTTLNTALYYADLTAQGAGYTTARVNAELNAYPVTVKNNASLALTPSANKAGVVYAMNGDSKTLEEFEFQRGSSGTYFDASGVMQLAAPNVPRINFESGVSKGLLIEPASSNLVPFSGMGNYGAFQAIYAADIPRCSVVVEANKSCIRISNLSSTFRFAQRSIVANKVYTYSFWIKGSSNFNLRLANYSGGNPYSTTYHDISTNWQRITKTFISASDATHDIIHMNLFSGTVAEFYIADIQLEEGPVATSYIPTTNAVVTRLADKVLSKRPTVVFPKNSLNVKTAEYTSSWLGNGVDKLSISGKNLLLRSNSSNLFPSSFGSVITNVGRVVVSEWDTTNASRVLITGGANVIKSALNLYLPKNGERISASGWFRNNHSSNSMIVSSNQGSKNIVIAPGQQFKVDFGNIEGNGVGLVQFQLRTYDAAHDIDFSYWNLKCEKGAFITAWQPATEDYIKVDENGNIEISYTEPIHIQQFSLISRELSQEEV